MFSGFFRRPRRVAEIAADRKEVREKPTSERGPEKGSPTGAKYSGNLKEAVRRLKDGLAKSNDIVIREFKVGPGSGVPAVLVFAQNLVDKRLIDQDILSPLRRASLWKDAEDVTRVDFSSAQSIRDHVLDANDVKAEDKWMQLVEAVMIGDTILLIDGADKGLIIDTKGFEHRTVDQTNTESSTRGSQEGFAETLMVNLGLLRRRLRDENFRIKLMKIGRRSRTDVALCYIEGVCNPRVPQVVEDRIKAIESDEILDDAAIGAYLRDDPFTLFPLDRPTERPDFAVRELMQGKMVILTGNAPTALVVPSTINDFYRTTDDYVHTFWEATVIRWVRLVAGVISVVLLPLYVALTAFHPELIPTDLALAVSGSREGVPFPEIIEVGIMEGIAEILRESILRLPKIMSVSIGVVGGLVLGQAAVQAKIVTDLMLIMLAVTVLSNLTAPSIEIASAWRLVRWMFLLAAGFLGLYGIVLMALVLLAHLSTLTSFGVPYLAPYSPFRWEGQMDGLVRAPLPALTRRPSIYRPPDQRRREGYEQPDEDVELAPVTGPGEDGRLGPAPGQDGGEEDGR